MVCPVVITAPKPLPVLFANRGGERFSMSLTAWIVTLRTVCGKLFLCRSRLSNWGAVNKNRNWSDRYTAAHRTTSLL